MSNLAALVPISLKAGEKITTAGIYALTMAQYHSQCCDGPSVSSSGLRTIFAKSPAHFWLSSSLNPDRVEDEDNAAMILGRAAHHLFAGEGEFQKHFVIRPEKIGTQAWNGNANVCKEWAAEQQRAGLTILTPKQVEQIKGMADAIAGHDKAPSLLRGQMEISLVWKDQETGIWLKSRPDALPVHSADGADLKCVSSVTDDFLTTALNDRGYFQQGGLVGEAFNHVLGINLETFAFVFVEQDRPHCVRVESLQAEDYDRGWQANRAALRLMRRCLDTNQWPGPVNRDGDGAFLNLRQYHRDQIDRRITRIIRELAA